MKTTKGLSSTTKLRDLSNGYYPFAKNGVKNYQNEIDSNEPGFTNLKVNVPFTLNGIIETPEFTFLFSTDDTNSAISRFDGTTVTTFFNDSVLSFKLGFKKANWIKGTATKNYKNEWVLAWRDGVALRYINTSKPILSNLESYSLFPIWKLPSIKGESLRNGNLEKGSYIPFIQYESLNGTITPFSTIGSTFYIKGDSSSLSGSFSFSITGLDVGYKWYRLAFLKNVNGVTTAWSTDRRLTSTSETFELTSLSNQIGTTELLTVRSDWKNANVITQHGDRLLLADLKKWEATNVQQEVNNITVRIKSELKTIQDLDKDNKTFLHGEVYALSFVGLKRGVRSRSFHIPGPTLDSDALSSVTIETITTKKFRVFDTATYLGGANIIFPGMWENENETYPAWSGFPTGKVRHFKTPSIRWCKQNLYSLETEYGKTKIDRLGFEVTIPQSLKDQFDSWEIHYSKRNSANSTVLGQSLSLLPSRANGTTVNQSTGGNFGINWNGASPNIFINKKGLRFHSPDILRFKPSFNKSVLINQLFLNKQNIVESESSFTVQADIDGNILDDYKKGFSFLYDYTIGNTTVSATDSGEHVMLLKSPKYVRHNSFLDTWDNRYLETAVTADLTDGFPAKIEGTMFFRFSGSTAFTFPTDHKTYLSTIVNIRENVYVEFYKQQTVLSGTSSTGLKLITFDGDAFSSVYSFATFGFRESNDVNPVEGNRFVYSFLGEHTSNVSEREEVTNNEGSRFYPVSGAGWITKVSRSIEPNQWRLGIEMNTVNEFHLTTPYNNDEEFDSEDSSLIIASAKQSKEYSKSDWQTFLPFDEYRSSRTRGRIMDLYSDGQRVFIKHQFGCFITNGPVRINGDGGEVFLKSVDFMSDEAQEIFSDDSGGTINTSYSNSIINCPLGHIWIDHSTKNVWLWKGELKSLNSEMNTFFREVLINMIDNPKEGYCFGWDNDFKRILFTKKGTDPFTLSYSVTNQEWVYFHDYVPECYFRLNTKLFSFGSGNIYSHGTGEFGKYYEGTTIKNFVIDVPIKYEKNSRLESVGWKTEIKKLGLIKEFETFDELMIYNTLQCSGLLEVKDLLKTVEDYFWFNEFQDNVINRGEPFLTPTLKGSNLIIQNIEIKTFWNSLNFDDDFVIVRLIYKNRNNNKIDINEITASIIETER